MKSPHVRIGSLPPIQVGAGTLVAVAVLAVVIYPAVAPPGVATGTAFALAIGIALFMMFSVLVHEAAHALVAHLFGARVDHIALTLWGGHTQYRGGSLGNLPSATISLAGPLSNIALAAIAYGVVGLAGPGSTAAAFWGISALLNVALAMFNLLPGLPMDGGRALESVLAALTRKPLLATRVTAWIGRAIAVVVVAWPLLGLLRDRAGGIGTGDLLLLLWAFLIAGLLWQGASRALESAALHARIDRLDLSGLARPVTLVPAQRSLAEVLESVGGTPEHLSRVLVIHRAAADVIDGSRPDGAPGAGTGAAVPDAALFGARILPEAVMAVPVPARASTPVSAVSSSLGEVAVIDSGLRGSALISAMVARPCAAYLIKDSRDPGAAPAVGHAVIMSADVNALLRGATGRGSRRSP